MAYKEASEPANPFDEIRPKKMAQPYTLGTDDESLSSAVLEKGITNTGTGLRLKGQQYGDPEYLEDRRHMDELESEYTQRRAEQRLANAGLQAPQVQPTIPMRTTT